MALKQDERALLQLVCERGQSYEDLAGLLGISEDEVRAKARHALTELGGADPDAEVGLTDYLLGQADPIGRADVVRYLQQDAETRELATTIVTKLQAIAPGATLPSIPEPRGRKPKSATSTAAVPGATPATPSTGTADSSRPSGQGRLIAAIVGGGVVLLFVILAIAGVFSGDDSSDTAGSSSPSAEAAASESQRNITPVKLDPVGGSGVAGGANFGLANDQLFIDIDLDGLDPDLGKEDVYVIWLMINDKLGYPVSRLAPDDNGSISSRLAVPTPVAAAVGANAQSVLVTQTSAKQLAADIQDAVKASVPVVSVSGKKLASGDIPLARNAAAGAGAGATTPPDTSTTTPDTTTTTP